MFPTSKSRLSAKNRKRQLGVPVQTIRFSFQNLDHNELPGKALVLGVACWPAEPLRSAWGYFALLRWYGRPPRRGAGVAPAAPLLPARSTGSFFPGGGADLGQSRRAALRALTRLASLGSGASRPNFLLAMSTSHCAVQRRPTERRYSPLTAFGQAQSADPKEPLHHLVTP